MITRYQKLMFLAFIHLLITVYATFYDDLKPVVGIYDDASRIPSRLSENAKTTVSQTIFLTMINTNEQRQLVHNFQCFKKRLGMKIMVIGLTPSSVENVVFTPNTYYRFNQSDFIASKFNTEIRSPEVAKLIIIREILQLGYHILFAAPEVIMLRNPLPYVIHQSMDLVFATSGKCISERIRALSEENELIEEINESFFFVRSNIRTLELWNDTLHMLHASNNSYDYQHSIMYHIQQLSSNMVLHTGGGCRDITDEEQIIPQAESASETFDIDFSVSNHHAASKRQEMKERKLTMCSLDYCMFTSSCLLPQSQQPQQSQHLFITIHANCVNNSSIDQKKEYLQKAGVWMLRSSPNNNDREECDIANWKPPRHNHHNRDSNNRKRAHKKAVKLDVPDVNDNGKPVLEKSMQDIQSIQKALLLHQNLIQSGANNKGSKTTNSHRIKQQARRREVKDTTVLTKAKKYDPNIEKKPKPFKVLSSAQT